MAKLKEYSRPQDNLLSDMLSMNIDLNQGKKEVDDEDKKMKAARTKSQQNAGIDMNGNKFMIGVDYRNTSLHYNKGVGMLKQFGRTADRSNFLPVHMQHHSAKLAMNQSTYNTL